MAPGGGYGGASATNNNKKRPRHQNGQQLEHHKGGGGGGGRLNQQQREEKRIQTRVQEMELLRKRVVDEAPELGERVRIKSDRPTGDWMDGMDTCDGRI